MDILLIDIYRQRAFVKYDFSMRRMRYALCGLLPKMLEEINADEKKALKEFDSQYPHIKFVKGVK